MSMCWKFCQWCFQFCPRRFRVFCLGSAWLHFFLVELTPTYGVILSLPLVVCRVGALVIAAWEWVPEACAAKAMDELWASGPEFFESSWTSKACPSVYFSAGHQNVVFALRVLCEWASLILVFSSVLAFLSSGCCDRSFCSGRYLAFTYSHPRSRQHRCTMILLFVLIAMLASIPFQELHTSWEMVLDAYLNFDCALLLYSAYNLYAYEPGFRWKSKQFTSLVFARRFFFSFFRTNQAFAKKITSLTLQAARQGPDRKRRLMKVLVASGDEEQTFRILTEGKEEPLGFCVVPGICKQFCTLLAYLLVAKGRLAYKPHVVPLVADFDIVSANGVGLRVHWTTSDEINTTCFDGSPSLGLYSEDHREEEPLRESDHLLVVGWTVQKLPRLDWPGQYCPGTTGTSWSAEEVRGEEEEKEEVR